MLKPTVGIISSLNCPLCGERGGEGRGGRRRNEKRREGGMRRGEREGEREEWEEERGREKERKGGRVEREGEREKGGTRLKSSIDKGHTTFSHEIQTPQYLYMCTTSYILHTCIMYILSIMHAKAHRNGWKVLPVTVKGRSGCFIWSHIR